MQRIFGNCLGAKTIETDFRELSRASKEINLSQPNNERPTMSAICKATCRNGNACPWNAKAGDYCKTHSRMSNSAVKTKFEGQIDTSEGESLKRIRDACASVILSLEKICTSLPKPKRVLELFSGTGSVGKVFEADGWEVVSVDMSDKFAQPTHLTSILEWDYAQAYPVGHFDLVHASPPCATFSNLKCGWLGRQLKGGGVFTKEVMMRDELEIGVPCLRKAEEIIKYFQPKYWTIENPQTGRMKNHMGSTPFNNVSYCQYGFGYRKQTRLWNNFTDWKPKVCGRHCPRYLKHESLPSALQMRYRIPPSLIQDILEQVNV